MVLWQSLSQPRALDLSSSFRGVARQAVSASPLGTKTKNLMLAPIPGDLDIPGSPAHWEEKPQDQRFSQAQLPHHRLLMVPRNIFRPDTGTN